LLNIHNYEIYEFINIYALFLGLIFGIVSQKNQFCFSGSIKDYLLTNSTKRASSVIMAMIVAITTTQTISYLYTIDLEQSIYFKNNINYFSIVIGASLFGIGMMVADGCSSRHIIKFAQGDIKSLITIIFVAISAYTSTKGILHNAVSSISTNQTLIEISSKISNFKLNIYVVLILLSTILWIFTKSIKRVLSLKDGFIIGILISIGWYITGVIGADSMERVIPFTSITFVYQTAKTLEFFTYYKITHLSFGVCVILGVASGAFLMSKINRNYSFGCTSNLKTSKLKSNIIGGSLMGVGGVMAIGCTTGQGLTGLSTLAFASLLAICSMLISGYITALYLKNKKLLPSCFVFDWDDNKK
jgi:uncharacterized membrane protein YedE/YeeE